MTDSAIPCDLLIRGGTVIDPEYIHSGKTSITVNDGVITGIGTEFDDYPARQVIDVQGSFVTPGLIDIHAHVLKGIHKAGVDPDICGVEAGVTTVVDAGSTGYSSFGAIPNYVAPASSTNVRAFLHIGPNGLLARPDIGAGVAISIDDTVRTIRSFPEVIVGVKLRLVGEDIESRGVEYLDRAKQAALGGGVPLMIHIGDTASSGRSNFAADVLSRLDPGDIVTHAFTPHRGGLIGQDGQVLSEVADASNRGVLFDTAPGRMNFSFDVAKQVLGSGLVPDTISTDLTVAGRSDQVFSLTEVMSRFFGLGFDLEQIVRMVTLNSANAIGSKTMGRLRIDGLADLSILNLKQGRWRMKDALGKYLEVDQAIVPRGTIRNGVLHTPGWGPHEWGWDPERVPDARD